MIYLVLIILTFSLNAFSAEIIQDKQGNYYIMKKDGTFTKLPAPKPGNKYVIKKKTLSTTRKQNKSIFKRVEKKIKDKIKSRYKIMNDLEKKEIWNLITTRGDFLKGKLKDDPRHPLGRNSYAHICSLIISKFGCSYKEVKSNKVLELKRFISEINE